MGTEVAEEQRVPRNSGNRGTVGTEVQRNSGYTGTVYSCSAGHKINGHDSSVLVMIGSTRGIPFIRSHRTGVTRELLEMLAGLQRGLNP